MKIITCITFLIISIFFIYINVWFYCKTNFTKNFININTEIKIFKHKFKTNRRIYYTNVTKILLNIKKDEKKEKNMNKIKYFYKHRRCFKIFIIKNILFFPESFENEFSIAIEFCVVNTLFKEAILNG